jgi:hypothetical protein
VHARNADVDAVAVQLEAHVRKIELDSVAQALPSLGMRALPPALELLTFLLNLRLLNRSCFIDNPSGILSLSTWDHVRRKS